MNRLLLPLLAFFIAAGPLGAAQATGLPRGTTAAESAQTSLPPWAQGAVPVPLPTDPAAETSPNAAETAPEVEAPAGPTAETSPNAAETAPEVEAPASPTAEASPHAAETAPEVEAPAGHTAEASPEETDAPKRQAPTLSPPSVPVVEVPIPGDSRTALIALPGPAEAIAKDLAATLPADRSKVEQMLGLVDHEPIEIRVAYGKESFQDLQPEEYRVPGWAAGVAFSGMGLIVVDGLASGRGGSVRTVLIHELAHIVLGRSVEGRVPRWFNEGFALHAAGEWSLARSATVGRAALARALIPLSDLDFDWPHSLTDVDLAYAQSASMVSHLISVEGGDALRRMVKRLSDGLPFEEAIHAAYGKPLIVLEIEWKQGLTSRYGWLPLLVDNEVIWAGGALLLLVGAWRSRRRAKRRLEDMEDEPELPLPEEQPWVPTEVKAPRILWPDDEDIPPPEERH